MPSEKIIIMEKEGVPADAKLPTEHGNFRVMAPLHSRRAVGPSMAFLGVRRF